MNIKQIILAVTVLAATSTAFAEGGKYPVDKPYVSTKTRAEVITELVQAREQTGGVSPGNRPYSVEKPFVSTKTRAEVEAELVQAQAYKLRQRMGGNTANDLYSGR